MFPEPYTISSLVGSNGYFTPPFLTIKLSLPEPSVPNTKSNICCSLDLLTIYPDPASPHIVLIPFSLGCLGLE